MTSVFLQTFVTKKRIILCLTFLIVADKLHSLAVKKAWLDLEIRRSLEIVLDYVLWLGRTTQDWHMLQLLLLTFQKQCLALYKRQISFLRGILHRQKHVFKYKSDDIPREYPNLIIIIRLSLSMSVQGFKNLMKTTLFNDDSFQPLLKKNEEYRKVTQLSIDHLQIISKNVQSFQASFSKILTDYDAQAENSQITIPQYYHEYVQLYRNMHSQHRQLSQKLNNSFKEFTGLCNNIFTNYFNSILNFQGLIRSYKAHEQILFQLSKKYFRTHKTMVANIEYYKNSFTDVKLIYNMDEKIKRFNACEGTYKNLLEQLEIIQEKLKQINQEKTQIADSYGEISNQFKMVLKTIGNKLIAMAKVFMFDYCLMQKTMITYLAEKKFTLEKIELKTFFSSESKIKEQGYFNVEIDRSKCQLLPSFIVYSKNIKEQSYPLLNKLITAHLKELQTKIGVRMLLNKKILEVTTNFTKNYEKHYYFALKDIMSNHDKIKKRLGETFGNRLVSFLKSNNSILDISMGINEKLLKRTPQKLKAVQTTIAEQAKTLEIFLKELKSNVDKFFKKKQVKKIFDGDHQSNEFTEQQPSNVDLTSFKTQFGSFCQYITHLIQGFVDKIRKTQDQIKFQYNAYVNDMSVSTNEIYSLCCEYQELYFGSADFVTNFKKYEADIDKTLENQSKFFEGLDFGVLLKREQATSKIIFESEINKVQQYKKIKKPIQIEIEQSMERQQREKQALKLQENALENLQNIDVKANNQNEKSASKQAPILPQKIQKSESKADSNKYEQFLISKITLLSDEKIYKSFSCGMSDKIILHGRLYITNRRLCFHSKFNPSNVFFGQTFMQIPKKDILKIEKRFNAIVFDNSISITTINGEVFLTSFFSRNEAYDLICSALDLNAEEVMYEPQEIIDQPVAEAGPFKEDDDFQEDKLALRTQKIERMLSDFPYKLIYQAQFSFAGLDAFKFFKIFQQGMEFSYNRKTFKSWSAYIKDILEHKDYTIGQWTPEITQYLNSSNIKCNTPECFTKKISCLVPISNSGVPFMPKFAKSQEIVSLYIYSKDKFIFESTIQNSGVPYSDTFSLKLRKVFETSGQDKCKFTSYMYINFVTSTMMKSIIQSKSAEETKASFAKYEQEVNKYLRNLNKLRNKQVKGAASSDEAQIVGQNGRMEQYQKQIAQAKQSQEKATSLLKECEIKMQKGKKILMGSILLNILLILILII